MDEAKCPLAYVSRKGVGCCLSTSQNIFGAPVPSNGHQGSISFATRSDNGA